MPGIDPTVIVHRLNVSPSFSLVRQKKRVFAPERDRAIAEEVRKLQEADFIRERGIEVNPEKVKAIIELSPPRTVKEVQSLTGKIAALNSPSMPGEELFLYLAVTSEAISAALIREEGKVQKPVYFISRALRGAEERYPPMEKIAFALVTAARKLKPYFQAHTINVLTNRPLWRAMSNPESARRMALWAIELSEFDIQYQPRTAMKGQILADFVAEFTTAEEQGAEETPTFRIHTDGSSNKHVGGVGVVLHTLEGDKIECMIRLDFPTTNNEAEYEALVAGLELAIATGAKKAIVYSDSQIVTSQVNGNYDCKNERMKSYLGEVKGRTSDLQFTMIQIPREENQETNRLAKATSAEPMIVSEQVLSFVQISSLLDDISMQAVCNEDCWTAPIMAYLKEGKLPDNKENARKLKVTAARFVLIKNVLYKRGFSRPYLRCLSREEADYVMREIHEGAANGRTHPYDSSMAVRTMGVGYHGSFPYSSKAAEVLGEVGLASYRVESYDESKNNEALRLELDLIDEVRATAAQRKARYQDMMAKHYNSKVKHRDFQERNVLFGDVRRKETEPFVEHKAPEEVLPVVQQGIRQHPPPYFPYFQFIFKQL
ncbi:uncharacterized protein LOC142635042 [Castanea sativa]|uniref:uncharacterized protein LOC142635042 n=1 Tax=Castanea sativa TaxID=21020 RepID=UPI003F64B79E